MSDATETGPPLLAGAQRIIEAAQQQAGSGAAPGINQWLLAVVGRHGAMAQDLCATIQAATLGPYLEKQVREGAAGAPIEAAAVTQKAQARARERGKTQTSERDVCAVVLEAAGYTVRDVSAAPASSTASPATTAKTGAPEQDQPGLPARRPIPTLERFGQNLTSAAREGRLVQVIGREEELQMVVETLCRRTKRNPVLVGPAGVGKTALVEGLAGRIVAGTVPALLRDSQLWAVSPANLVAGAQYQAEFNRTVQALIDEASQPGIILFIDEMHSLVGAGGATGRDDLASMLKPALARGELACIAATTDDEYRRFIEPEEALERRFQPIRIQEMTPAQTLILLQELRSELARTRGVETPETVLTRLIDHAQRYMRNRHFPDKGVDLLEQCVAHALAQGRNEVTLQDASDVLHRLVGMPTSVEEKLEQLRARLPEVLTDVDATALLHRLEVSLRGLDLRPERPTATVLLIDAAAGHASQLATVLAESLFGGQDRVVQIEFGRMVTVYDVSMLLGAAAGYVGYGEGLPIHKVAQMPWCVVLCRNVDACHPHIREILKQAIATGLITDARGKRIYLSDAILLLTADVQVEGERHIGILETQVSRKPPSADAAEKALGQDFLDQVDEVCFQAPLGRPADLLGDERLQSVARRFEEQGVLISWDKTMEECLRERGDTISRERDWERFVDQQLTPLLISYLSGGTPPHSVTIMYVGGQLCVERPADVAAAPSGSDTPEKKES